MRDLLEDLHIRCEFDAPLAPLTWYRVGGPAEVLAHPSSAQQLSALAKRCHEAGVKAHVLGGGANLLVADQGVRGVVVRLDDPAFRQMRIEDNTVIAGAGADLARLVLDSAPRAGLAGLECLAGIPASVGGAIRMNAGGAFGDIGKSVKRIEVMDAAGQVYYRNREDLSFSYRKTNILARYILEVELELTPEDPEELRQRVKEIFLFKKNSQPLGEHSAGCAFKNPEAPPEDCSAGERISAGLLIDRAGLKGYQIGGARVSDHHANFVLARDGCKASDILRLLEHIEETVRERCGVELEREVVVWGNQDG